MPMNENDWEDVFLAADFFTPDQREQDRHDLRVKVAWMIDAEQFKGTSIDVSTGGLFVATEHIPTIGTECRLAFKLPTCDEPIRAIARVAWHREEAGDSPEEPRGFGVEFLSLTPQAQESVMQYIELSDALLFSDVDF